MATYALSSNDRAGVRVVKVVDFAEIVAGEALNPGEWVRLNSSGQLVKAQATTAANGRVCGITTRASASGEICHILKRGILDVGDAINSLAWDAQVFLSDTLGVGADAAGTVSIPVAKPFPGYGYGPTPNKLLEVTL